MAAFSPLLRLQGVTRLEIAVLSHLANTDVRRPCNASEPSNPTHSLLDYSAHSQHQDTTAHLLSPLIAL
jgi:hypothetical protein